MSNEPLKTAGLRPQTEGASLAPTVRSAGVRPCPSCGAAVNVNATVCPTCGEQLPSRTKKIRCRRCHKTASSSLVICPHCGRELHAAPSRLFTWGIPALVVVLFLAVLAGRFNGRNPVNWTRERLDNVAGLMNELGTRLRPDVTVAIVPPEEDAVAPERRQDVQPVPMTSASTPTDQTQPVTQGAVPTTAEPPPGHG